jgi:hypothetical protein
MQIQIVSGIYADESADLRTSYPRNYTVVPKQNGVSNGYLRPADGIVQIGTGAGPGRGGINWRGTVFRVLGTSFCSVSPDGSVAVLGDVGSGGEVSMDYSFDYLAIASGGRLYLYNGATLQQVTDPDLGVALDVVWVDGYFLTTDGENIVQTELTDPFSVNPLKYGSAESDPDPVVALLKLREEVYVVGRYTIQVLDNAGLENFAFQAVDGAMVPRGAVGTHACVVFGGGIAFVGGGRNKDQIEPPAVWFSVSGDSVKVSSREIDTILQQYSDSELASIRMEARIEKGHEHVLIHLPDRCLVYDPAASKIIEVPAWIILDSGTPDQFATYRARHLVWANSQWTVDDPTSSALGRLDNTTGHHFGQIIPREFEVGITYNEGRGAIFHQLELVCLPGRVPLGANPTIWTSYSLDGETWSQEMPISAGKQGERNKRLVWFQQGMMENYRMQRFRSNSDAHLSVMRLEAELEALNV